MEKVIVGMSGGVDSAVTAYLLQQRGYEPVGVTLRTWKAPGMEAASSEIEDAVRSAAHLGIEHHVVDCAEDFRASIVESFAEEYLKGRTPNPCVVCNRLIKWKHLLEAADACGAHYVATGHYAFADQLPNGRFSVRMADSRQKDQTYMLYRLSQEQLSRTIMPLGGLTKEKVRQIAEEAGIPVAFKKDSQEICFLPDGEYAEFIEETVHSNSGNPASEPALQPGNYVTEDGTVLGTHQGIIHYTIGQRKGLGLAMGHPVFVKEIRPDTREVVISEEEALMQTTVRCRCINLMSIADLPADEPLRVQAKVRYRHAAQPALLTRTGEDEITVEFDQPVRAPAPGQSAVFYDEQNYVVGGGMIV